jgi:hypothetical protein
VVWLYGKTAHLTSESAHGYDADQGDAFQLGKVWKTPKGMLYRVMGYESETDDQIVLLTKQGKI